MPLPVREEFLRASEPVTTIPNALIMPTGQLGRFSVVDAVGAPVVDALTYRKAEVNISAFVDRSKVVETDRLRGRYLFAGDFWPHFGHYIFESLSRMWVLDYDQGPLDGIIFLLRREGGPWVSDSVQGRILALLGIDLPIILVTRPTSVDELVVPRQGLGMGALAAGTPAVRRFFQERLRHRVAPKPGVQRLYISRLGFGLRRGGLLGEHVLQRNLERHGYVPYSPESQPVEDQLATYLGAEQVIGLDSSALHLFGFVARPEQELSIILRRLNGAVDLLPQIAGFSGRVPQVIERITRGWLIERQRNPTWRGLCEADFAAIGQDLLAAGMIDDLAYWRVPGDKAWNSIRAAAEVMLRSPIVPGPIERAEES